MDPKEELRQLALEAKALAAKAQGPDAEWTDADDARVTEITERQKALTAIIERREQAAKSLASFAAPEKEQTNEDSNPGVAKSGTLGQQFTQSAAYKNLLEANPSGFAKGAPIDVTAKNLRTSRYAGKATPLTTTATGNAAAVRLSDVDDLVYRPRRTLLDVITKGTTGLSWVEYRQVISKTNNAAIVPEASTTDPIDGTTVTAAAGGLKPLSTLTTQVADAKVYTYADGMEVTNDELADDGIIQTLIDSTLTENLDILVEDILLNGSGTGGEPAGILNTTGVLQQAYSNSMEESIRKGITKLRTTSGAQIKGVLLNPEDNEKWDLIKDTTGRYLGNGPFGTGPGGAWGYERIESASIPVGQALMGDFSTIHLLIRQALAIQAFNQHKDFAQRNLVYIRAELRAMQLIRNAAKLCVVDLAA